MTNTHFIVGFPPHQRFGALHPRLQLRRTAAFRPVNKRLLNKASDGRNYSFTVTLAHMAHYFIITITTGLLVVITLLLWLMFFQSINPGHARRGVSDEAVAPIALQGNTGSLQRGI
jgi:hypothetical protein